MPPAADINARWGAFGTPHLFIVVTYDPTQSSSLGFPIDIVTGETGLHCSTFDSVSASSDLRPPEFPHSPVVLVRGWL